MIAKKAEWRKPELVVLVRGRPEEGVLDFCKKSGYGLGPGGTDCPPEDSNTKKPKLCKAGAKS